MSKQVTLFLAHLIEEMLLDDMQRARQGLPLKWQGMIEETKVVLDYAKGLEAETDEALTRAENTYSLLIKHYQDELPEFLIYEFEENHKEVKLLLSRVSGEKTS